MKKVKNQYILFGMGRYSKRVVEVLGLDKVAMFVDNNCHQATYFGKNVISVDSLFQWSQQYPVMVSVIDLDAIEEISEQLWAAEIHFILARDYLEECQLKELEKIVEPDAYAAEIDFMKQSRHVMMLPYPSCQSYQVSQIPGGFDKIKKMSYCLYKNQRLYLPSCYKRRASQAVVAGILSEQDDMSPHRYFDHMHCFFKDEVFVDVGAAEGLIALEVIDRASQVYLFECDTRWIQALQATFEPWQKKTTILPKLVSQEGDGEKIVTVDEIFADDHRPLFFKVDIEGGEEDFLRGARRTLEHDHIKMSICVYHNENNPERIKACLESFGFKTRFAKGWVYLDGSFRRGVLYAEK